MRSSAPAERRAHRQAPAEAASVTSRAPPAKASGSGWRSRRRDVAPPTERWAVRPTVRRATNGSVAAPRVRAAVELGGSFDRSRLRKVDEVGGLGRAEVADHAALARSARDQRLPAVEVLRPVEVAGG